MVRGVVKRRQADPAVVLQLWDVITSIRSGKQVANYDRIVKYMERKHNVSSKEAQKQLNLAVKDELVVKETSLGKKGSRAGLEQDGYWCMEERTEESAETHDWYCFECHKPGEVLCCGSCYKVYHPTCAGKEEDYTGTWSCPMCEAHKRKFGSLKKIELYQLLTHVLNRMKDKARDLYKAPNMKELPNYYNLVYKHVDLRTIIEKIDGEMYRSLEEMEADTKMIVHSAVVYHGGESDRAELCRLTLADCEYDLAEIRLCTDCYLMSNNRTDKDWFLYACEPAHELVWAQMKGFGFWPAKVLQRCEDSIDVRFFGSRHQRAWIPEPSTRPIDSSLKKMNIKKTQGWSNANKELTQHQEYVKQGNKGRGKPPKTGTKRKRMAGGDDSKDGVGDYVSSSDAGQDHSISTSQASPDAHTDEPPATLPTPSKKPCIRPAKRKSSHNNHSIKEESSYSSTDDIIMASPRGIVMTAAAAKAVAASSAGSPMITLSPVKVKCDCEDKYTTKLAEYQTKAKQDKEEAVAMAIEKVQADSAKKEKKHTKKEQSEAEEKAVAEALKKAKSEWETEKQKAIKEAVKTALKDATEKMEVDLKTARSESKQAKEDSEQEMEMVNTKHEEEISQLKEEISQTKKRQWCINCEQEAMYHCCWNTSYCSITCQQTHWHKEHKRLCRRKR